MAMMRRVIAAVATTWVVAVTAWAQGASVDEVLSALNLDNSPSSAS